MSPFKTQKFNQVKYILMDVEGTTSDIHFVKDVLFTYSARELRNFLSENKTNARVQELIKSLGKETTEAATVQLLNWITEDVKHPVLKEIQGMIWRKGYETGVYAAPLYEEVLPCWQTWQQAGFTLGIYSSGSIAAQKLFFKHTTSGDVTHFLRDHFDLEIGSKLEASSYLKIAGRLQLLPSQILFLSDRTEELRAAQTAGYCVAHIVRPGTPTSSEFETYQNFSTL